MDWFRGKRVALWVAEQSADWLRSTWHEQVWPNSRFTTDPA